MARLKQILAWVLFALCLAAAFGFGYFVRGTVGEGMQTSCTAKTTVTTVSTSALNTADTQTTPTLQTTASTHTSQLAEATQNTTSAQTTQTTSYVQTTATTQTTTPTTKPQQTASTTEQTTVQTTSPVVATYILNTNSKKIHYSTCRHVKDISDKNRKEHIGEYAGLLAQGYSTCKTCFK